MALMQVSWTLYKYLFHAQVPGVWLAAENIVRQWASTYSVIHVISGSILGESQRDQDGNYDW